MSAMDISEESQSPISKVVVSNAASSSGLSISVYV